MEDARGGLLAALLSWAADEVRVAAYESAQWDPVPALASVSAAGLASLGGLRNATAAAQGLPLDVQQALLQDGCGHLLAHDLDVLAGCCGAGAGLGGAGQAFGAAGRRTFGLSGVARLAAKSMRSLLFTAIGDAQPLMLPTLLLRHAWGARTTGPAGAAGANASALSGVAAVVRSCLVALPAAVPNGGQANFLNPQERFSRAPGAFFAAGETYRLRLRAVITVIEPQASLGSEEEEKGRRVAALHQAPRPC